MTRRHLLQSLALAAAPKPVDRIELFRTKVNRRGDWLIVRITTADGVSGLGDASHGGSDEAVIRYTRQFFDRLRGRSIFDIEWFRRETQAELDAGGRAAVVAFSGIEQCLWDIGGKAVGVPVYDLFGGALRTEIRNYANINRSTDPRTPDGFGQMAARAARAGFDAVKLAPFDEMPKGLKDPAKIEEYTRRGIACAAAVRPHVRDLLIDVHSHYDRDGGLELARRFEPLNLFWLEETTPGIDNLAAINRAAKMPTAGGESIHGVRNYYPYIAGGAVDIVMPDIKYCGGLLEVKKVAAMAEGAGLQVSPHGPASPVGNAAAAHVCATLPNFLILEFSYGEVPWRAELIEPAEELVKGHIRLSRRPGFGIALNEKRLERV